MCYLALFLRALVGLSWPQLASVCHVEAGAEVVAKDGCWPPLLADGEARLLVLHQLDAVCLDVLLHVVPLDKPPEQAEQHV